MRDSFLFLSKLCLRWVEGHCESMELGDHRLRPNHTPGSFLVLRAWASHPTSASSGSGLDTSSAPGKVFPQSLVVVAKREKIIEEENNHLYF